VADTDGQPGPAALIMASSGTTGPRKIIPLSEAQLLGTAAAVARHHRLTPDDRGYCPLPLFHINGLVVGVLSTLVAGSTMVLDSRFSRSRFWAIAAAHDVTWLNLVPAIIGRLADSPPPPAGVADGIRFARSASAPLAPGTLGRFEGRCGISVLETYGMTEAASQIAANPIDLRRRRPGSVGLGVGIDIRIVDETGHPVRHDTVGAVEIRGDQVVSHYWAATDHGLLARPARRAGGWLSTGDLGCFDEDGFLYLVGRSDDVINRGGEKIYPAGNRSRPPGRPPGDGGGGGRAAGPDRRRGAGGLRAGRRAAHRPGTAAPGVAPALRPGPQRLQGTRRHHRGRDAAGRATGKVRRADVRRQAARSATGSSGAPHLHSVRP